MKNNTKDNSFFYGFWVGCILGVMLWACNWAIQEKKKIHADTSLDLYTTTVIDADGNVATEWTDNKNDLLIISLVSELNEQEYHWGDENPKHKKSYYSYNKKNGEFVAVNPAASSRTIP